MKLSVLTEDYRNNLEFLGYEGYTLDRLYYEVLFFDMWLEHNLGDRETYTTDVRPELVAGYTSTMNFEFGYGLEHQKRLGASLKNFLVYLDSRGKLQYSLDSFKSLAALLDRTL